MHVVKAETRTAEEMCTLAETYGVVSIGQFWEACNGLTNMRNLPSRSSTIYLLWLHACQSADG